MNEFLMYAINAYFILLITKRACIGPQKIFARISGLLIVLGVGAIRASGVDPNASGITMGDVILCIGLFTFTIMIAVELWWKFSKILSGPRE